MEILPPSRIPFTFFLIHIFLQFSFTSQEEFYINCGSTSSITLGRRNFVGDANSPTFTLTASQTTTAENSSPATNSSASLYNTARVFRGESSWYEFGIVQNGTYILRLHFFPFVSRDSNLFNAKFDVSTSGIYLLSNFNVSNTSTTSNLPLIKEFLITINPGRKFRINFSPSVSSSSLAFINAIELNVTPSDPRLFIPDSATHVTRLGDNHESSTFTGLLSHVLQVIYRINVGGSIVTPDNDTLPRNWVPDDEYLLLPGAAKNVSVQNSQLNYDPGYATQYDAPSSVYGSAKVMNSSDQIRSLFNVSWRFNVSKSDKFLVRAHFCDIVSQTISTRIIFNLYINNGYSKQIDPRDGSYRMGVAIPFYDDFVVDSDDSGFLNISIGGPSQDSNLLTPFLNGLEIMKLMMPGLVSPIPKQRSNNNTTKIIIIIVSVVGGTVFVAILSMAIFIFSSKKRKTKSVVENFDRPVLGGSSKSQNSPSPVQIPHLGLKVPLVDILSATNNFDENLIIGKGGFGKVYKGTLKKTGTKIAVKRCDPGGRQGLLEFQTEIMLLSKIRHRHLVSLIGYCDENSEMVLVYEFMEKGTLREHLYKKGKSKSDSESEASRLCWERRLQLCIDAAKGLHYLHAGLNGSIIHRDIKSTNILLDENYVAKVADFGISRIGAGWGGIDDQKSHVTTQVKGTFGYLDPEYYESIQLTQKSDVYSFGVVLLEVLCARPAIDNSLPGEEVNLAEWGTSCIVKGELDKLMVDPFLVGQINSNSLRKFTETVQKCLKDKGVDRPNMVDVVWDLEYALQLQKTASAGTHPRQPEQDQEQPMEYTTTDVSCDFLMLPAVINSLPTHHSISFSDHEDPDTSFTTNASEVFSQLRIDEAR